MSESDSAPFPNGREAVDTNTYNGPHRDSKAEFSDNQLAEEMPALADVGAAIQALEIFADNGVVAPCYIPIGDRPSPVSKRIALADQKGLKAFLEDAMREGNAYFHPNPLQVFSGPFEDAKDRVEAHRRTDYLAVGAPFKARREDVSAVNWFYADIDPVGQEGDGGILFDKNRERIAAVLRNQAKLRGAGIPGLPTVIVDSGGGYWGFWKLETPLLLDGQTLTARIDRAEEIADYNRGLQVALAGLLGEAAKVDACVDICRIARLPGMINIPHDGKRARGQVERLARIVAYDPQRLYEACQFPQAERPAGAAAAPSRGDIRKVMKSIPPTEHVPGTDAGEKIHWLMDHYPNIPIETLNLIFELDCSECGDRKGTLPQRSDGKTDRSAAYWRVLLAILRAYPEFPLQLLVGILTDRQFEELSDGIYNVRGYKGRSGHRRSDREADREARFQVAKAFIRRERQKEEQAQKATAERALAGAADGVSGRAIKAVAELIAPVPSRSADLTAFTPYICQGDTLFAELEELENDELDTAKMILMDGYDSLDPLGLIYRSSEDLRRPRELGDDKWLYPWDDQDVSPYSREDYEPYEYVSRTSAFVPDRAGWLPIAVRDLVRAGISDALIGSLLMSPDLGISSFVLAQSNPVAYINAQIRDAVEYVEQENAELAGTNAQILDAVANVETQKDVSGPAGKADAPAKRKTITVLLGRPDLVVRRAQRALIDLGSPIYQRGEMLMRSARVTSNEGDAIHRQDALVTVQVGEAWLTKEMARAADWVKPSGKQKEEFVPTDPNGKYARMLLESVGEWKFPALLGVRTAPTILGDGRVITQPGYDERSRFLLDFSRTGFLRYRSILPLRTLK